MSGRRPPRWMERLLEWALPAGLSGQSTLGDLAEEFESRGRRSLLAAWFWYSRQTASLLIYRIVTGTGTESSSSDSDFAADLRWSVRTVVRHPGFAFGVVAVLGLGLGANTAVYSVVDGTLRNTSWWAEPDQTVAIWPDRGGFSLGELDLYTQEQTAYRTLGGYLELAFSLEAIDGVSESVNGALISPALFQELSVQPVLGRALVPDDGYFGAERVVVLGHSLWLNRFEADPSVIGRSVTIGGGPATVVGVQGPNGLAPGGRAQFWIPLTGDPRSDDFWKEQSYTLVGVLKRGGSLEEAQESLMAFTRTQSRLFPTFYPDGYADGIANVRGAEDAQRELIRTPLILLLVGTGLLMLVTALNVGNLLLGRSVDRRKEMAVRASLGAQRARLVRQLLVEGMLLTAMALLIGLAVGSWGGQAIGRLFVEAPVVAVSSVFTSDVMLYTLLMAGLAWGVLNGVPVVHFLRSQHRGLTLMPASGRGTQRALVTVQAGLATLLLVSASLLVVTVSNLRDVPLGFDPTGLLTVELSPPEDRVTEIPAARDFYERLVTQVASVPGVTGVGLTGWLPLRKDAPPTPINLESDPVDPREAVRAPMQKVDPGFFAAMEIQPLEGRLLDPTDLDDEAPSAIVVNESLARLLWPDGSAIGQRIATDPHAWESWAPVVGVIPDVRSGSIAGPIGPALYVALAESPARDVTLVVRTDGRVESLINPVRDAITNADRLVPIRTISSMSDVVRAAYATAWVMMGLLLVLAALATGLGAIGIYSVLAHHVALNRREIGVRMALGAEPGSVVGGVVRSGLTLAGMGIIGGTVGALLGSRYLQALLFEVSALSPLAYLAPAVGLLAAAALAAWVPAVRAGRLPPAEVLRGE